MKNSQKGLVNIWLVGVITILVIVIGYLIFFKNTDTTLQNKSLSKSETESIIEQTSSEVQSQNISNWKSYVYKGGSLYLTPAISFKYPSDWSVDLGYYTTSGGSKEVTGIILTSPNGIDQISYGVGRQSDLTCKSLKKMTEIQGKIECVTIKEVPFYLVYQSDSALGIYNQIIKTIE